MKQLYETILGSTGSGLRSHEMFAKTFLKLFHDILSNDLYERDLVVTEPFGGGPSAVEVPIARGHEHKLVTSFKKRIAEFKNGLKVYGANMVSQEENPIDPHGKEWVYLFLINMEKAPEGWKDEPYFEIGLHNNPDKDDADRLVIQDFNGMLKKIFEDK